MSTAIRTNIEQEKMGPFEPINGALRDHQSQAANWKFREPAEDLHLWAGRMVSEFKLQIGTPCLFIENLRRRRLGHFRPGRNGFGLHDEIAIDASHLERDPYWDVLDTLLHELLHSWQAHHGKAGRRNFHNKQFRDKAAEFGLLIDANGRGVLAPGDTPFRKLLRKHGIEVPELDGNPCAENLLHLADATEEKLKLFECPCGVKVRIGRARFNAKCLDCGG